MDKLKGRVALVTGGQRGLGAAILTEFAKEGARCLVNYPNAKEKSDADATLADLIALGVDAAIVEGDISTEDGSKRLIATATGTYGRLDILVNNAGLNSLKTWAEIDGAIWDRTMAVNLDGMFHCCRAAVDVMMKQQRGNIINIASIAPFIGRGNADYIASKAAALGLTRSLARQFGKHNIRANSLSPGFHDTAMTQHAIHHGSENAEDFIKQVPLGFLPKPDSIGHAALFLASDDSYYITGHNLVVDGGLTLM